ncbi:MAG: thioredoxin domain-containing protein [Actinobacteria bacterium]|nr:thioredoxin domain-containing protein [Actinomycetota bacterium]
MTGSGGWPLNIFLLPDGKPFYGGTYFPPIKMPQRASWMEVLRGVKEAYENNIDQLQHQANQLTQHIVGTNMVAKNFTQDTNEVIATKDEVALLAQRILQSADTQWGGFGNAPKFPQTFCLQMLLRNYAIHKDDVSVVHAIRSIDKMIQGGIYDHVGGGFSRYSTDAQWQAPHFEKMLYDQALLLRVYAHAAVVFQSENYRQICEEIVEYVMRDLRDHDGGFFSAEDADSLDDLGHSHEGHFYVFTPSELRKILPENLVELAFGTTIIWPH